MNHQRIFEINSSENFNDLALEVFKHQYNHCEVYHKFCDYLKSDISTINHYSKIPFLPIQFFKSHTVASKNTIPEKVFESSSTTGKGVSKHYVSDVNFYHKVTLEFGLKTFVDLEDLTIVALLPSYLEKGNSSLVSMVKHWMDFTDKKDNGFYLYNFEQLEKKILELESKGKPVLLIGVSFALIDFFTERKLHLKHTKILETGGMKGRKKEWTKEELHNFLKHHSGLSTIYSEYGMTELLSQGYSSDSKKFKTPDWMKVITRDLNDPFHLLESHKTGALNIIDLANIDSCSFIATDDLGKTFSDGTFEILGRIDHSDLRGCSLLSL